MSSSVVPLQSSSTIYRRPEEGKPQITQPSRAPKLRTSNGLYIASYMAGNKTRSGSGAKTAGRKVEVPAGEDNSLYQQPRSDRSKASAASCTMCSPMAKEEVAPGDGAFST